MDPALDLAHDLAGPPTGRLVVLLHGLSSSRESYGAIVPELADAGWRVCNADLRGHGGSPWGERYRALDYAADVRQLIESSSSGPAVVVGHSLGGLAASALAAESPDVVAGIFLEDPPLFEGDDATRAASPAARFFPMFVSQVRGWQAEGITPTDLAAIVSNQPSPHGGSMVDRVGMESVEARARSMLAFDPAAMDSAISGDMWIGYYPEAPAPCPVTILRADPGVGAVFLPDHADRYLAANPHASIEMVAGQAHGIHDDPDGRAPYLQTLAGFLSLLG